jgi:two-component system, chemotaxis family, CheB/CheR fusion protein
MPKKISAPRAKESSRVFPVVGAGASAGGLEAFTTFLKNLPANSGMAFVLIQHLDPNQHIQLTELLAKATKMPVREVNADMAIKPDHVYVIAPARTLSMSDGRLRVENRPSGRNLPVDHFFRSLAEDRSSKAIGVVLSGTASDGTLGLKAIKAEGGITFAQEPSTAKFDGMPGSAIAAGVVDFVLPPEEIAKRVVRLARHPYVARKPEEESEAAEEAEAALNRVFHILRIVTGNDFTHYKHTTIRRRIQRRMVLHSNTTLDDYVTYLQANPGEVRALADDFLICVTSFFREPECLEALAEKVFPQVLKSKSSRDAIRAWVPGCATGEEAYSLAIGLTEFLERTGANVPIQIFGTDISESSIEKARAAVYTTGALADVSAVRLERFFVKAGGGYQITKSIRESCIFARQNLNQDPPFHNLDFISCCNLLIYFGPVLQKKALATFHYALKQKGFLMLGPSESVSVASRSFSPLDKKLKLYAKEPQSESPNPPFLGSETLSARPLGIESMESGTAALDVQKTAERMLLAQYAPAGVIVDDALKVVHVRGDTGPYLQLAPGEPTYNLLKMAREGLAVGLRTAIIKAKQKKSAVSRQVHMRSGDHLTDVNLQVIPVSGAGHRAALHFLILFEQPTPAMAGASDEAPLKGHGTGAAKGRDNRGARENSRLKDELTATKDYLQSIIEEQEASTEELKAANEEAQATNEELETAKEELQSANEELNTVNEELKTRNASLIEANNDLSNVLTNIRVPLVMVGRDLRIRRFTPSMGPMLNLIDSDIGRLISDLKPNIAVPDLPELLREVVNGRNPAPREIQAPDGRWYYLQALPYRVPNDKMDGALLVLLDIDEIKHSRDYAEAIVETVRQPLVVLTEGFTVQSVNQAFCETFRVRKEEAANRSIYDLGNGQWNIPKLREALERVLPEAGGFEDFAIDHKFAGIGRKRLLLTAHQLRQLPPYGVQKFLLAIEDVTEHREADDQLLRTNAELKHFAYAASHDLQEPLRMVTSFVQLLAREYKGKLDAKADQFIGYAVEGAQRMESLLKGMSEYWQSSERGETHPVFVDSNQILERALLNLRESITSSGAIITHDSLPTVWGEEVGLLQVFQNLVANAIKYRTKKPPRIHIAAARNDKEEWVFSIKDNGIGIDPQYAEKIFGMFNRLNGHELSGNGIGLAICRKVVERLGGSVWVESAPGRGADFKVAIPIQPRD